MSDLITDKNNISRLRSLLSWIITILLGSGFILSLINLKIIMIIGGLSVLVGILIEMIYSIIIKGLKKIERLTIFLMSFFFLIYFIFRIQHWKGIILTNLALVVPIGLCVFLSLKKEGRSKPEFSFMLIMTFLSILTLFSMRYNTIANKRYNPLLVSGLRKSVLLLILVVT